ncbi:hypothetical protein T552_02270 [Pneumocystis carinii B80]|uniref:Programmed cell death protein 2 C-terminal domain-containing protein n=1 Tax=Pneumocystis carinii (strain B80) TaxID=1408658 RepID=A0A0W4ZFY6_PNEC8|nr:hypothetical protein T552_02270 [Pneumocystis carinii B80]KTW27287.1 hypothetical protein T552_02270 [Pneumocystis carinii B80]
MNIKPVLLAFPDEYIKVEDLASNPLITRLGGLPIGLDRLTKPPLRFSKCKNCNQIMPLILQSYAHIDHIDYDRVIYVWACCHRRCQYKEGSVRVIRGILYQKTENTNAKHSLDDKFHCNSLKSLGNTLFNAPIPVSSNTSNPFRMNSTTKTEQDLPALSNLSESSDVKISQINSFSCQNVSQSKIDKSRIEEWPPDNEILQYHIKILRIVEENEQNLEESTKKLGIEDFKEKFIKDNEKDEWSGEVYEKSTLEKGFRMFIKKIRANPQQCVRYNRKGQPLYYSLKDFLAKKIKFSGSENPLGRCQLCNSQNVFELQIMPNTINILEENVSIGDMLWGTIIIGTCSNDCIPDLNDKGIGYTEEWVGVQWEEMIK